MTIPAAKKYTKEDFLNYKQLAKKLNRSPAEIYAALRHHYKAHTSIKYTSNNRIVIGEMVILSTRTTSNTNKHAFLLHPIGYAKFIEYLNKGTQK